ncbi:MAG: cyclic nucleotide-binding/CBS domain-containing protein [Nitrospiria bacterium]
MIPNVETLMTKQVHAIESAKSVQEAAEAMARLGIGSLLVTHGGSYIGMITEVDVVRKVVAKKRNPSDLVVRDVMASPLISIQSKQSILEANGLMEEMNVRHLAVTRNNRVVGVVSVRDFLHPLTVNEKAGRIEKKASGF